MPEQGVNKVDRDAPAFLPVCNSTVFGVATPDMEGSFVIPLPTVVQESEQFTLMLESENCILAKCRKDETPWCQITNEMFLIGMNHSAGEAECYEPINSLRNTLQIGNKYLIIENISDEQAGLYKGQVIDKWGQICQWDFNASVPALNNSNLTIQPSQPGSDSGLNTLLVLVGGVLAVGLVAAAVGLYKKRKRQNSLTHLLKV